MHNHYWKIEIETSKEHAPFYRLIGFQCDCGEKMDLQTGMALLNDMASFPIDPAEWTFPANLKASQQSVQADASTGWQKIIRWLCGLFTPRR